MVTKRQTFENVKDLMQKEWNEIAPDLLGSGENSIIMHRNEVIDIVLDRIAYTDSINREEMLAFMELSIPRKKKIAKEVFTGKLYGW